MTKKITIPLAIILAGSVVAITIYIQNRPDKDSNQITSSSKPLDIRPIDETDHIMGNPSAEIIILEYIDTSCPACRSLHETMKVVMEKYGNLGQVAWVQRHLPSFPNSKIEAESLECVVELGGKSKFWAYLENLYTAKDDGPVETKDLTLIAEKVMIDREEFDTCIKSGRHAERIEMDFQEAIRLGAIGTPFTLIISTNNNTHRSFTGTIQFETLDRNISSMLSI